MRKMQDIIFNSEDFFFGQFLLTFSTNFRLLGLIFPRKQKVTPTKIFNGECVGSRGETI